MNAKHTIAQKRDFNCGVINSGGAGWIPTNFDNRLGLGGVKFPTKDVLKYISRASFTYGTPVEIGGKTEYSYLTISGDCPVIKDADIKHNEVNRYYWINLPLFRMSTFIDNVGAGTNGDPSRRYNAFTFYDVWITLMWLEDSQTLSFFVNKLPQVTDGRVDKDGKFYAIEYQELTGAITDTFRVYIDYIPQN